MRIVNQPELIDIRDYQHATQEYIRRVKKINGVKAIFTMGSVGAPGLSDIDLIIVTEHDLSLSDSSSLSNKDIDERLFLHGPIILPETMLEKLQTLVYASNLELIWGENEELPTYQKLDSETQQALLLCYLVDFTESRMLQFADIKDRNTVDKRVWLTKVWSVTHSYKLYETAIQTLDDQNSIDQLEKIIETRAAWLSTGKVDDHLFLQSLSAAEKLNETLFVSTLKYLWGSPTLPKNEQFWSGRKEFCFSNQNSLPSYSTMNKKFINKKLKGYYCEQLPAYLAHLSNYDTDVKPNWVIDPKPQKALSNIMQERFSLVKAHAHWLHKHAKLSGSLSGYTGIDVSPRSAIKIFVRNQLLRILA